MCALYMVVSSCACGSIGNDSSILFFFSAFVTVIRLYLAVLLGSSHIYVVKHILLCKTLWYTLCLKSSFYLYPIAPPYICGPSLCILESRQFVNVNMAYLIVLSFSKLFYGLTWIISNICETSSLTTSFYTSGVNYTGLHISGSPFDVI